LDAIVTHDASIRARTAGNRPAAGLVLGLGIVLAIAPAAFAAPRAVLVEPLHVQRGEVEPDEIQKLEWTLRNEGDTPLQIEALDPTCYCTTAKPDAWQVPPGGSTTIRVAIDPSDFVGTIHKGFVLQTDDPRSAKLETDVEMTVRPGIAVVPPELDFGVLPAGVSPERTVDLKAAKSRPFKVKSAAAAVPYVTIEQEPLQTDDRAGVRLYVQVKPGAPAGPFTTAVVVQTDDPAKPRIEIAVRGTAPGGLQAEPARVVFEAAAPGSVVGTVAVRGEKGLKVTGVRSSSPSLETAIEPQTDGSYRLSVKVASGAKPGRLLAKVFVSAAGAASTELTIPVMGLVR
jgi:hypothetical protein